MPSLSRHKCGGQTECVSGILDVEAPANIGEHNDYAGTCSIGAFTYVNGFGEFMDVTIGRYCSIARHVIVGSGEHFTDQLTTHPFASDPSDSSSGLLRHAPDYGRILDSPLTGKNHRKRHGGVAIGNDVWIGTRATILNGVTVSNGAIVGAGSVVTRNVEPYSIVAGNPARIIRYRFHTALIDALLALEWWNYDLAPVTSLIDYSDPELAIDLISAAIETGELPLLAPRVLRIQGGTVVEATSSE